jgi:hypothetical protein
MLSKLSIRLKLIAVISLLLMALAGTGLFAISKMQVINDHTVDIATSWLPSVRVLGGEIRTLVYRYHLNLRQFVIENDPEKKAAVEKLIQTIAQEVDKKLKDYDPLVTSPEERALADEFTRNWKEYLSNVPRNTRSSRRRTSAGMSSFLLTGGAVKLVVGRNRDGTKPPVRRACIGSIASPWRYDGATGAAIRPDNQRCTAILRYVSWAAVFPI